MSAAVHFEVLWSDTPRFAGRAADLLVPSPHVFFEIRSGKIVEGAILLAGSARCHQAECARAFLRSLPNGEQSASALFATLGTLLLDITAMRHDGILPKPCSVAARTRDVLLVGEIMVSVILTEPVRWQHTADLTKHLLALLAVCGTISGHVRWQALAALLA